MAVDWAVVAESENDNGGNLGRETNHRTLALLRQLGSSHPERRAAAQCRAMRETVPTVCCDTILGMTGGLLC